MTIAQARAYWKREMARRGYAESTTMNKAHWLESFFQFLLSQDISDMRDVTRRVLDAYVRMIDERISERRKAPLSSVTKRMMLQVARELMRVLYRDGLTVRNASEGCAIPWREHSRMKVVLSVDEMGVLLNTIDPERELQTRVIAELLYSAGFRSGEICRLTVTDYEPDRRVVWVRKSKGGRDRFVVLTECATWWLDHYLTETGRREGLIFRRSRGQSMEPGWINRAMKRWAKEAGVYRKGFSAHSVRHATATHLLAGGADIRMVQELLGHESVETTVSYTHEREEDMKRRHKRHHPNENAWYREIDEAYTARLHTLCATMTGRRIRPRPSWSSHGP